MATYTLYHAGCDDGFGAAYAVWKVYGSRSEYLPVQYGHPMPEIRDGSQVFIVDFSYPRDVLEGLAKRCKVLVLDHHKTAEEDLKDLSYAHFDMNRSGAGMAWDYFHEGRSRPSLINFIEDRDLWRFRLTGTPEVSAALRSYPQDFKVWDGLMEAIAKLGMEGAAIQRYKLQVVQNLSKNNWIETWDGRDVVVVNSPPFIASELCDFMLENAQDLVSFAAVYCDIAEGKRVWSLRSRGDVDVSDIAKARGGGGHKNAAGFIEST